MPQRLIVSDPAVKLPAASCGASVTKQSGTPPERDTHLRQGYGTVTSRFLPTASCEASARRRVMMGKPVVRGTRITVELILEKLGAGETMEQILDAHPRLTREGIQAALSFAVDMLRSDVVYPLDEATV